MALSDPILPPSMIADEDPPMRLAITTDLIDWFVDGDNVGPDLEVAKRIAQEAANG